MLLKRFSLNVLPSHAMLLGLSIFAKWLCRHHTSSMWVEYMLDMVKIRWVIKWVQTLETRQKILGDFFPSAQAW